MSRAKLSYSAGIYEWDEGGGRLVTRSRHSRADLAIAAARRYARERVDARFGGGYAHGATWWALPGGDAIKVTTSSCYHRETREVDDYCYTSPVGPEERREPRAYGGICRVVQCVVCGATQKRNLNAWHEERGYWRDADGEVVSA